MLSFLFHKAQLCFFILILNVSVEEIHAQKASAPLPQDHEYYLKLLGSAKDSLYSNTIQLYDEYIKEHPGDYRIRIEKCKLIQNAYYDSNEDYNPKEEEYNTCLEELMTDFPGEPDVMLFKAESCYGDSAISYLESVLASYEENPDKWKDKPVWKLYNKLAEQYSYNTEKSEEVIRYCELAIQHNDTLDLSLLMAKKYRALNNNTSAVRVLLRHLDSTEASWELNQKGSLLLELGEPKKALIAFGFAKKDTTAWQNSADLAQAMIESGLYKEARVYLVKNLERDWNKTAALKKLFDYDLEYGSADSAAANYGKIVEETFWNDPVGMDRMRLFISAPQSGWSLPDILRVILLLLILAAVLIVPYLWILPIHYAGGYLKKRGMLLPSNDFRWGLKHFWLACSIYLFADTASSLLFDYNRFLSYASATETTAINKTTAHMTVFFISIMMIGTVLLLKRSDLSLFWGKLWSRGKSIGTGIGIAFLLRFILGICVAFFKLLGYSYTPMAFLSITDSIRSINQFYHPLAGFLIVVILVPVYEEILFRGVFLSACEKHMKFFWANCFQAAVFAAIHLDWKLFIFYFAVGMVAGIYRNRSQSLAPGIVMHITNNLLAFIAIYFISKLRYGY